MSHFTEDVLAEFVLGTLPADERAAVETALGASDSLRAQVAELAELLTIMPAGLRPVPPPPELSERLLAAVATENRFARFAEQAARMLDLGVEKARALLAAIDTPASWVPGLIPGMALYHLDGGPRLANAIVGFVRLDAGVTFPHHEHKGRERVLVLQGTALDDDGTVLGPGQEQAREAGTSHAFRILDGPPCIYLTTIEEGVQIGDRLIGPNDPAL